MRPSWCHDHALAPHDPLTAALHGAAASGSCAGCGTVALGSVKSVAEFRAAADPQFLKRVREMGFHGSASDVELPGDVAVAVAAARKAGDSVFRRRQRAWAGAGRTAWTSAGGVELAAGSAGEELHPVSVGEVEGASQRDPGLGALVAASKCGTERHLDPDLLESGR